MSNKSAMKIKSKKNTKYDYSIRINSIIDFIDTNLDEDLSLDFLSEKVSFSPFHFHRIFTMITNETPNSFIARKRIEKIASIILIGTNESLNDLALKHGFSCGYSFSRAFKKIYGVTPSEYKDNFSKIGVEVLTYEKYICSINNIKNAKDEHKC